MLLERENTLKTLASLADGVSRGRGAVALVAGEAGIGKTALMDAFCARVDDTHVILQGGCDALFTPRPLGPIHDMGKMLGEPAMKLISGGAHSSDLFAAIVEHLVDFDSPIAMVVEDTHWADYATLDFLKFLGRRISMMRVLLVMTYRDDEVGDDHPLKQVIGDLPPTYTHRLKLEPLSKQGVAKLATLYDADHPLPDLFDVSGGNPFFVTELLATHERGSASIPASVKDAVAARLNRLAPAEREFLEIISIIPGATPTEILEPLFGADGELYAMAAIGRGLLVKDAGGALRFRHELARLATLSRLQAARQKEIHAQVLAAFEDAGFGAKYDLLMHHAAGAQDAPKVLHLAPLAATRAARMGAHREAAAHLATALQFIDHAEPELAAEIYEGWAYEAGISISIDNDVLDARRHAITLWRALGRMDKVGENLRWLSRLHWYRGESFEATRFSEEAVRTLESIPASAERAMAYSLRSQLHMLNDQMDESISWGERALALADEFDDVEVRIHALNNIGTARIFRGDRAGIPELEESLALSLKHGFHEHAARVYTNLGEYAVEFRDFPLAERILTEGIAFDIQYDLDTWTHYLVGRQAQLRLQQGRLRDAETIANGVIKIDKLTLLIKLPALTVLAKTKLRLGVDDADKTLAEAFENAMATDELQYIVPMRIAHLEAAWLKNAPDAAREHLDRLFSLGSDAMHAWRIGEVAVWATRFGVSPPTAFLENLPEPHAIEIDGRSEDAAEAWRKIGDPYQQALSLIHGAENKPGKRLADAQRILLRIEALAAAGEVERLARVHGVLGELPRRRRGPYKAARNHPVGLTKREQTILGYVAAGASNAEIADMLSRSQRTIEHHVSSILTKLNVSNRMEAMLRVQHEPWLAPRE